MTTSVTNGLVILGTRHGALSSRHLRFVCLVRAGGVATLVMIAGCDGTGPASAAISLAVSPSVELLDSVGDTVRFTATVIDGDGVSGTPPRVDWRSGDPTVASIDRVTGLAVAVGPGRTQITATSEGASGSASLEVYLDPHSGPFVVGETYFGRNDYTEYRAGNLPLIIAAPHGGLAEPAEITDRALGVTSRDRNTQELARAISDTVQARTGRLPHLVICRLHRRKLDANREVDEAAQGNPFAERAWMEHHGFVEAASATIWAEYGRGLFLDLHGHGHDIQRVELGYLLLAEHLELPAGQLDQPALIERSSIRALVAFADTSFDGLVRGPTSLGSLLELSGFPAVPSAAQPDPGGQPYFTGGYSTVRHGSRDGGMVSAIQIEAHWTGLRDTAGGHAAFAAALADALDVYLSTHFAIDWAAPSPANVRIRSSRP